MHYLKINAKIVVIPQKTDKLRNSCREEIIQHMKKREKCTSILRENAFYIKSTAVDKDNK